MSIDVRIDGAAVRALEYRDPIIEHLVIELDEPPAGPKDYRSAAPVGGCFRAINGWRTPNFVAAVLLTLFVNGFMAVWFTVANANRFEVAVGVALHLCGALWLLSHTLGSWLNRSLIEIREGRLTCVHEPLPVWFDKAKPVELAEVEMFVPEPLFSKPSERGTSPWRIDARLKRGGSVTVVTRLQDEARARILA